MTFLLFSVLRLTKFTLNLQALRFIILHIIIINVWRFGGLVARHQLALRIWKSLNLTLFWMALFIERRKQKEVEGRKKKEVTSCCLISKRWLWASTSYTRIFVLKNRCDIDSPHFLKKNYQQDSGVGITSDGERFQKKQFYIVENCRIVEKYFTSFIS